MQDFISPLLKFIAANKATLLVFATSALGAGCGAWFGARAILALERRKKQADIQTVANISVAALIALLGKLINFKKDLAFPAAAEGEALGKTLAALEAGKDGEKISIRLEPWPETDFDLKLPSERLFEYTARDLDVIQLLKMLEYNLSELSHLVRQRNILIQQMNGHQTSRGQLPLDRLHLYLRQCSDILRNTDENLFFIDRAIEKLRAAIRKSLPKRLHGGIADVKLRPETRPLMPPEDYIKGWVK